MWNQYQTINNQKNRQKSVQMFSWKILNNNQIKDWKSNRMRLKQRMRINRLMLQNQKINCN